ncbi:MAG TPA: PilN domain-containing protein [Acidobacteriota bacterium]|nr:PilN domain-containing protein [Acidobacteriota bacterium]
MIKVNLLKDKTARASKTFVKPAVSSVGLVFLAVFIVAAGIMGGWAFYINRQIAAGTIKRDELRLEEARLQKLQKEIETLEKLKQQRQSRIAVIEQLKEAQSGPVQLLNTIIASIPQNGNVWLTQLSQKDGRIMVIGHTRRPEVIPDLLKNLTASGTFASVDLEIIERNDDISRFSLVCTSHQTLQAE